MSVAAFCRAAARIGRLSTPGTLPTQEGLHRSFSKLPDYLAGAPPVTDADIEELNQVRGLHAPTTDDCSCCGCPYWSPQA